MRKNLLSLLEISPVQKEVFPSKMMHMSNRVLFRLEEDKNITEKLPESIESSKFVSHRATISGDFNSRKDSQSRKFDRRPQIFVKLSFRELHLHKNKLILTNV